jgi:uncharacterized membrane protein YhaH (DUF805 family)
MSFSEAIGSVFRNYATFSGRAPRSEYWYYVLFTILVAMATGIVDMMLFPAWTGFSPITSLANLLLLLPSISVGIRRLHDVDRSGWWFLLAFTVIGVLVLLYWAVRSGTPGSNRFGPDPLTDRQRH